MIASGCVVCVCVCVCVCVFLQAELKVLMDMTSPSFTFARDLLRHNLVRGWSFTYQSLSLSLSLISAGDLQRR